jgi:hypothetical protein
MPHAARNLVTIRSGCAGVLAEDQFAEIINGLFQRPRHATAEERHADAFHAITYRKLDEHKRSRCAFDHRTIGKGFVRREFNDLRHDVLDLHNLHFLLDDEASVVANGPIQAGRGCGR